MDHRAELLLADARARSRDGPLRRRAHYECLKDRLRQMDLPPEEYQNAARKIAAVLGL